MTRKETAGPRRNEEAQRKALRPAAGRHTEADIAKLLAASAPDGSPAAVVTCLPRNDILAAEEGVFQWRRCGRDPVRSGAHIAQLVRALTNTGRPFDPLLVFQAGGKYFVMDGHHRLAAYEAANWRKPVPVEVFQGSLDDARFTALQSNCRDKLPMKPEDKTEAIWRLVQEDRGHSKQQLVDLGLVSNGTIGNMRKRWL
jgi:ParB-like chromosome segregation protein Spo0J